MAVFLEKNSLLTLSGSVRRWKRISGIKRFGKRTSEVKRKIKSWRWGTEDKLGHALLLLKVIKVICFKTEINKPVAAAQHERGVEEAVESG